MMRYSLPSTEISVPAYFPYRNCVTYFNGQWLVLLAIANGDYLALLGLLLGSVRNDDTKRRFFFSGSRLYQNSVCKGFNANVCHKG
jgi:hypothetical protein